MTHWMTNPGSSRSLRARGLAALAVLFAWLVAGAAVSADSDPSPLGEYHHAAWLARDGAPPKTWAMAQDRDGYLWLGGPSGLSRFDGQRFDGSLNARLPYRQVMSLFADANGDLWIGDRYGAITQVHGDTITAFKGNALPSGTVMRMLRSGDGVLWAVFTGGLVKFVDGRWQRVAEADGFTATAIEQAFLTDDRSLWIKAANGGFHRAADESTFRHVALDELRVAMIGVAGATWRPHDLLGDEVRDPSGAWWIPTESGIQRMRWQTDATPGAPPAIERFTQKEGLSGTQALTAIVDREGTVWVATVTGLDQFRRTKLTPLLSPTVLYATSVAAAPDGGIWIGSRSPGALRYHGELVARPDMGAAQVTASTSGADGAVYMGGADGLFVTRGGEGTRIPLPPGMEGTTTFQALTVGSDGALWIASRRVARLKNGHWDMFADVPGIAQAAPLRMVTAPDGSLWFGYRGNVLLHLAGETNRVYGPGDGITAGNILGLSAVGDHVWIAGDAGVNILRDGKAFSLRGRGDEAFLNVSGIVEAENGDLWLNALDGLFHITRDELAGALGPAHAEVAFEKLTEDDGLLGPTDSLRPAPSLVQAKDGRLWVATSQGVSWIDPGTIRRNTLAPLPTVVAINQQGVSQGKPATVELPAGTTRLQVRFTAPSLAIPSRAMFRYRLGGLDRRWQEAGPRREATFENLGPGEYDFETVASNEDGVWSATPAVVHIRILPTVMQTWWFRAACIVLLLCMAVWLFSRRLRHVSAQIGARMAERERIARELHDTVLQSMQGLLLQIESAIKHTDDPDVGKKLRLALASAERAMVEGRDKVRYLRFERRDRHAPLDAPCPIEELLAEAAAGLPVDITGRERDLTPAAAVELQSIVREMVINATRHSRASLIEVRATFHATGLTVGVYDNGIGIAADVAETGRSPGHWGLAGMRERARQLGGKLTVAPMATGGTAAEVWLPGRRIYVSRFPGLRIAPRA